MTTSYASLIREAREQRGFSQVLAADRLGLSRSSYIAIENGSRELSLKEANGLAVLLGLDIEAFTTAERPDYGKYKQMILAFLRMNEHLTKTKLAKLLYLSDFSWFYTHLESMSGMQYRKIQYGPVADTYFRLIDEMVDNGEVSIEYKDDGAMLVRQERAGEKVDLTALSQREQKLMSDIDAKWKGKKTAEIVAFTHKQMPYMFAEDNTIVSYDVFTQEDPNEIY